jgi:hypothetical protein
MPIHDWTRVDAGLFHDFHQSWSVTLRNALNSGVLPPSYFALVEQRARGPIPDVLALKLATGEELPETTAGTIAVAATPPRARLVCQTEAQLYANRANRVTVRHRHGDVVAIIEIVSPGNKGSRNDFRSFVEKTAALIGQGIHALVVDLFPPGPRDPEGIHKGIWDQFAEEEFSLPRDKRLTVASYDASGVTAYVEPVAVGDVLPAMPLFLKPGEYVPAPLEATYQSTWDLFPTPLKRLLTQNNSETR